MTHKEYHRVNKPDNGVLSANCRRKHVVPHFSTIMIGIIFILTFLAAFRTSPAKEAQVPLESSFRSDSFESDTYRFEWPIHKIAIIGAGPGYVVLQSNAFQPFI